MTAPLSILFLFPSFAGKGGIQRFNRTLVHASAAPAYRIALLSVVDSSAALSTALSGVQATVYGAEGSRIRYLLQALWMLSSRRWDVVFIGHVNLVRAIAALLPWTRSRRAKPILVAHGVDVWGRINRSMARAIATMWRVLCVSEYTRASVLQQVRDLPAERCLIFANALSETWKAQQAQPSAPASALPQDFVLSVTRLASSERYKGIVSVIESMPAWADRQLGYVVVGDGDDLNFLQRVAQRCGVAHRVIFLTAVNDAELAGIYRRARLFLLPSGKEGFGIVFLEAMYFAVPVIAARSRGAVDVAREGETAWLVTYGDVVAIAEAVNRLSAQPAWRAKLVAGGRALVTGAGEFTEAVMAARWQQLLQGLRPSPSATGRQQTPR